VVQDKIKRAITWLRKSLEITEKTTLPGTIEGQITPVIDVLGWERLGELETSTAFSGNNHLVNGPVVPVGFLRFVASASVETDTVLVTELLWLDWVFSTGVITGVQTPFSAIPRDAAGREVRVALMRPIVMSPGDNLRGRCNPILAGGERITLNQIFVDIPIGEYIQTV